MKRSLFFIGAVFVAGFFPVIAQKGPSIIFDKITVDFSRVTDGEILNHVFKFANKGDATLEIMSVEPACGCTSAVPSPSKIAPGQSGRIEVNVTTEAITAMSRSLSETVSLSKTVTVNTNDPKQPQIILTVTAVVEPEFALSEPQIYFGTVQEGGKEVTKEITIEISSAKVIKLLSAASTDSNVTVRLEPVSASDGGKVKVVVVQKPPSSPGLHSSNIVIKTTSQLKPELKIPVKVLVTKSN